MMGSQPSKGSEVGANVSTSTGAREGTLVGAFGGEEGQGPQNPASVKFGFAP